MVGGGHWRRGGEYCDSHRSHEIHIGGAPSAEKGMWNLKWPWAILRKGRVKIARDCQKS